MNRNLLLISNSTNVGEPYLGWPKGHIQQFLAAYPIKRVLFIPYAGVGLSEEGLIASYNVYETRVKAVYETLGYEIYSIHHEENAIRAVEQAEAIAVGGGNTFHLLAMMYQNNIIETIRKRVGEGMPYMGWSAGSNVACPSIKTTNDMPIIEPKSFEALNLIPFQINPHYLDVNPEGHGGETREQRIEEFEKVNHSLFIAGLREGCLLEIHDDQITMTGSRPLRIFKYGEEPYELTTKDDLTFLLK